MFITLFSFFILSCNNIPVAAKSTTPIDTASFCYKPITERQKEYYQQQIYPIYNNLLVSSGFNGAILIAKNGEIIFEDYKGVINYKTKEPITANTTFHVVGCGSDLDVVAYHLIDGECFKLTSVVA